MMTADRAQAALIRALAPVAGDFAVVAARSTPWSSATFEGARHRLALRLDGDGADARAARLIATVREAELPIRGGFVADIAVTARLDGASPVVAIEALTIEESAIEEPAMEEPAAAVSADRRAG